MESASNVRLHFLGALFLSVVLINGPVHSQEAYSKYTSDSVSPVLTSAFFSTKGVVRQCGADPDCYYIHSDSPFSFVATDPGRVVIRHEYDYAIKGGHFDRGLAGAYVRITGYLEGGSSFSNYSISPISIALDKNDAAPRQEDGDAKNPSTLGFDKTYRLTGEIRSGVFEMRPSFKQSYYYMHLSTPVTFDSKGAQGVLLRQYDIGININHEQLGVDFGSLVGKVVGLEGTFGFSVDENGSPACCSLSVSVTKINL